MLYYCCSVAKLSDSSWPYGLQQTRLPCPSPSPRVCPSSCPLNWWCHPTISSSVALFFCCLRSLPASGSLPVSWLFSSGGQSMELQLQHQSFQWIFRVNFLWDWLVWSPCCPRDSQEPSPAPQFKSISSWVLCLLYGPFLTCICDYWKHHSCDCTDLFKLSGISAF